MSILHANIIGKGVPLLILHGFLGMSDNWKSLAKKLTEEGGFEVHAVDQRNHGRSFQSDNFNYQLLVEDLYNYLSYYQLKNINLLGHSMGGKTAMMFATTYPEIVHKLVVADIAPKEYPPHHQDILNALNSVDFSVHNSRKLIDEKLAKRISEIGVRQFLLKNTYWVEKGQLGFRFNLKSLTENYKEIIRPLPPLAIYKGKTLFLRGEKSNYILPEDSIVMHKHFPNTSIKTIANAGHWLHAENPKDFYKELVEFLS